MSGGGDIAVRISNPSASEADLGDFSWVLSGVFQFIHEVGVIEKGKVIARSLMQRQSSIIPR